MEWRWRRTGVDPRASISSRRDRQVESGEKRDEQEEQEWASKQAESSLPPNARLWRHKHGCCRPSVLPSTHKVVQSRLHGSKHDGLRVTRGSAEVLKWERGRRTSLNSLTTLVPVSSDVLSPWSSMSLLTSNFGA